MPDKNKNFGGFLISFGFEKLMTSHENGLFFPGGSGGISPSGSYFIYSIYNVR